MKKASTSSINELLKIINYTLGILFIILGVLNLFLVHPVPGIFYLIFSLIYFPQINKVIKKKTGYIISNKIKIPLGFLVIWGTLAVGDLAEIYGL